MEKNTNLQDIIVRSFITGMRAGLKDPNLNLTNPVDNPGTAVELPTGVATTCKTTIGADGPACPELTTFLNASLLLGGCGASHPTPGNPVATIKGGWECKNTIETPNCGPTRVVPFCNSYMGFNCGGGGGGGGSVIICVDDTTTRYTNDRGKDCDRQSWGVICQSGNKLDATCNDNSWSAACDWFDMDL